MYYEINIAVEEHKAFKLPIRAGWRTDIHSEEIRLRCQVLKQKTDLLKLCLKGRHLVDVSFILADLMVATAGTCVQFGINPAVDDLIDAFEDQITFAQKNLVAALNRKHVGDIKRATAGMEIVIKGLVATLNIPYKDIIDDLHTSNMSMIDPAIGEAVFDEHGTIVKSKTYQAPKTFDILKACGFIKETAVPAVATDQPKQQESV